LAFMEIRMGNRNPSENARQKCPNGFIEFQGWLSCTRSRSYCVDCRCGGGAGKLEQRMSCSPAAFSCASEAVPNRLQPDVTKNEMSLSSVKTR
jgi:hypothetical protein